MLLGGRLISRRVEETDRGARPPVPEVTAGEEDRTLTTVVAVDSRI